MVTAVRTWLLLGVVTGKGYEKPSSDTGTGLFLDSGGGLTEVLILRKRME